MEKDRIKSFLFKTFVSWSVEREVAESFKGGKEATGIIFEGSLGRSTPYLDVSWISK